MAFSHIDKLEILDDGKSVGALTSINNSRTYAFQYFPEWVRDGYSISPIFLPLSNKVYTFNNLNEETFKLLPPPIADFLPDRFGNSLIESELAKEGVNIQSITALDRLAYVGKNAMGSLEFKPSLDLKFKTTTIIDISEMVSVARDIVFGDTNSDSHSNESIKSLLSIGTSAGGARPKAIINIDPKTNKITAGQVAKKGLEPWLIKFDGVVEDKQLGDSRQYGKIEYAYSLMARDCGINFPETKLLKENNRAHFMTKRFDRTFDIAGKPHKVYMQTLCGMSGVDFNLTHTNDYAQLFTTMRSLNMPEEDITEAFKRMVFNFASSNCDDHSKNHSFIRDEFRNWRLSPAYDMTFAFDPNNRWLKEHLMAVMGVWSNPTTRDFMVLANKFEVQYAKWSIKLVNESVSKWTEFAKAAGIDEKTIKDIGQHHYKVQ